MRLVFRLIRRLNQILRLATLHCWHHVPPSPPTGLIRTVCLPASSSCPLLPHLLKPQLDLPSHLFPPRHQPWDFGFWPPLRGSFLFTSSSRETHTTSLVHLFSPSLAFKHMRSTSSYFFYLTNLDHATKISAIGPLCLASSLPITFHSAQPTVQSRRAFLPSK